MNLLRVQDSFDPVANAQNSGSYSSSLNPSLLKLAYLM
jgi:hypothetical protein